jgi:hypothetical protein
VTRGQQGNALQAILAMGFALDGERGETIIETRGVAHRITFAVDPIRRTPEVKHERAPSPVQIGVKTTVKWPERAGSIVDAIQADFVPTLGAFSWLNPHLSLTGIWNGETSLDVRATAPDWRKWRPSDPTSPRWYDIPRLSRLIAAEIAYAEDRGERVPTVRDFIAQFRGLARTQTRAAICDAVGASATSLRDFFDGGPARIAALLAAMQAISQPINPKGLGVIGRSHLAQRFAEEGCDQDSFDYRCVAFEMGGLPYVIEAAFAHAPDREGPGVVSGLNFSPLIGATVPFQGLSGLLDRQFIEDDSPVLVFLHLACPRLDFLDKGKTTVALPPEVGGKFEVLFAAVTKKWAKQAKAEIRDTQAFIRRREALLRHARAQRLTQKEAAFAVMEEARLKASANGTLPANARQIFYVARPLIATLMNGAAITSQYFTQTLLPAYLEEREPDWEPAYDARGHFSEPHTGRESGLGTLDVEEYLASLGSPEVAAAGLGKAKVSTHGPQARYGGVLFIEKEGFMPLIEAAQIGETFDLLVTSSKGFSVTAARRLIDVLCGKLGLPLYILHDFDVSGFGIAKTLTSDSRRYKFKHSIARVFDLGLRLADIEAMGLDNEEVAIGKNYDKVRERLRINRATNEEISYLLDGEVDDDADIVSGHRVELNAMTSDLFVAFVGRKLIEARARKVVPAATLMIDAYRAVVLERLAQPVIERWLARIGGRSVAVPGNLEALVRAFLAEHPAATWDAALRQIAWAGG